jgi:hypothetical protein
MVFRFLRPAQKTGQKMMRYHAAGSSEFIEGQAH